MSLKNISEDKIGINLILGMCQKDGISKRDHYTFMKLVKEDYPNQFDCKYLTKAPPIHSKVYSWIKKNGESMAGFIGSSNYSQTAFGSSRREVLVEYNPSIIREYYNNIVDETIDCTDPEVYDLLNVYEEEIYPIKKKIDEITSFEPMSKNDDSIISSTPHVIVDLRSNSGQIGKRSGLNWGQREGREPNQAYINLRAEVYKSDFFPERGHYFTIITDDNKMLIVVRAQDYGKAIETPHNNSLLGEYFRFRLAVPYGKRISLEDLENYGRTHIDFYKLDEETYLMDFSTS